MPAGNVRLVRFIFIFYVYTKEAGTFSCLVSAAAVLVGLLALRLSWRVDTRTLQAYDYLISFKDEVINNLKSMVDRCLDRNSFLSGSAGLERSVLRDKNAFLCESLGDILCSCCSTSSWVLMLNMTQYLNNLTTSEIFGGTEPGVNLFLYCHITLRSWP